ncbi:MAG: TolC family protein [Elusimicrobiota bacterium]|jgi:outer membrane protein TolC|nr:TolC family protein [Elusimicrobiota bacterium]
MFKKIAAFSLIVLISLCNLFAQKYRIKYSYDDNDPISLENAIRLALENNYELLLTEQDVIIAEQRLKEAKFLYLPQISVNAAATAYNLDYPAVLPDNLGLRLIMPETGHRGDDFFYGAGVQATQYLYTGGRTSSTVSMANATLKEALSRYEAVKSSVIYKTKEAFLNYLFLQNKETLIKDAARRARKIISKSGSEKWRRILINAEMSVLEGEIGKTEEELAASHLKMLNALNKEINSKIHIAGDFIYNPVEVDLAKITLLAMELRPELKSALYKLEMDNIAVKLSLAKRYPDVILGLSYDRLGRNNLTDENFQATLALKLPLSYDFGTQLKQKQAEQRQTVLRRAAIEDSIRVQVREAYNKLMYWQGEVSARADKWEKMNKEISDVENSGLENIDIVKIFDYYYKTGVSYLEGVKQQMLAIAGLELAVGQDLRL